MLQTASKMRLGTIALLGDVNIEPAVFDILAASFSWGVDRVATLCSLREISAKENIIAVFFDARNLEVSWSDALESVLAAAPRALPIVCTGFSEPVLWAELADAGAFTELRLPIDEGEARRCLGFIWAAKRGDQADPVAAPAPAPGVKRRLAAVKLAGL